MAPSRSAGTSNAAQTLRPSEVLLDPKQVGPEHVEQSIIVRHFFLEPKDLRLSMGELLLKGLFVLGEKEVLRRPSEALSYVTKALFSAERILADRLQACCMVLLNALDPFDVGQHPAENPLETPHGTPHEQPRPPGFENAAYVTVAPDDESQQRLSRKQAQGNNERDRDDRDHGIEGSTRQSQESRCEGTDVSSCLDETDATVDEPLTTASRSPERGCATSFYDCGQGENWDRGHHG